MMEPVTAKQNGHSHLVADAYGPGLDVCNEANRVASMDLEELREFALTHGIPLHHSRVQERIEDQRHRARARELDRARDLSPYTTPKAAERVQRGIAVLRDLWAAFAGSVVGNFAPSVMLIAVCVIEGTRFAQGISLLDARNAGIYALAAMITFVTILWRIAQEREDGNIPPRTKFSMRFALGSMLYILGIGRDFAPRRHTFAELAVLSKGAVQWLIVLVGTWGGLATKMSELPGQTAWGDIEYIFASTGLQSWGAYLFGFVIALALLPATEFAIQMVYDQYKGVAQGIVYRPFDSSSVDTTKAEETAEAEYLRALIMRELAKR